MINYGFLIALDMPLGVHLDDQYFNRTDFYPAQFSMIWMRCVFSFATQSILYYELWCGKPTGMAGQPNSSWRLSNPGEAFGLRSRFHFIHNRYNLSLQQNYAYHASTYAEEEVRVFADSFLTFFYDFPVQAYGGRANVHELSRARVLAIASSAVARFNTAQRSIS